MSTINLTFKDDHAVLEARSCMTLNRPKANVIDELKKK